MCFEVRRGKVQEGVHFLGRNRAQHRGKSSQTHCLLTRKSECVWLWDLFVGGVLFVSFGMMHLGYDEGDFTLCCGKSFALNVSKTWACFSEKAEYILIAHCHKQCDMDLEAGQSFLWIELSKESVRKTLDSHGNPGHLIPREEMIYLPFEGGNLEDPLLSSYKPWQPLCYGWHSTPSTWPRWCWLCYLRGIGFWAVFAELRWILMERVHIREKLGHSWWCAAGQCHLVGPSSCSANAILLSRLVWWQETETHSEGPKLKKEKWVNGYFWGYRKLMKYGWSYGNWRGDNSCLSLCGPVTIWLLASLCQAHSPFYPLAFSA